MKINQVMINKILKSNELRSQRKIIEPKMAKLSKHTLSTLKDLQRSNGYKSIDATVEALILAIVLMKLTDV